MRTPHNRMKKTGYIEEKLTAAINSGSTWGNRQTMKYFMSNTVVQKKDQWQREERDSYTNIATSLELDRKKQYRVWLEDDDENDENEAREIDDLRLVYDLQSNFVMTVVQI